MFNPGKMMKIKNAWDTFTRNHPKFPMFVDAVQRTGLKEGTIIEINVKTEDGKNLCTNIKLTESDMELLNELMQNQ